MDLANHRNGQKAVAGLLVALGLVVIGVGESAAQATCDGQSVTVPLVVTDPGGTNQGNWSQNGTNDVIALQDAPFPGPQGRWVIRVSPGDRVCGDGITPMRINVVRDQTRPGLTTPARIVGAQHVVCGSWCRVNGTRGDDLVEKTGAGYRVNFSGNRGNDTFAIDKADDVRDVFFGGSGEDALLHTDFENPDETILLDSVEIID